MNNINYNNNNNYSVAEQVFDDILLWAASKEPPLDRFQKVADLEKLFDKIEQRGYYKAKNLLSLS